MRQFLPWKSAKQNIKPIFFNLTLWKIRCSLNPKAQAVNKVHRQLEPYFPDFLNREFRESYWWGDYLTFHVFYGGGGGWCPFPSTWSRLWWWRKDLFWKYKIEDSKFDNSSVNKDSEGSSIKIEIYEKIFNYLLNQRQTAIKLIHQLFFELYPYIYFFDKTIKLT